MGKLRKALYGGLLAVSALGLSACQRANYPDGTFDAVDAHGNRLYSTYDQVMGIASTLGCDPFQLHLKNIVLENGKKVWGDTKSTFRLAHNNGEPIWISFDKAFPQDAREIAEEKIEYLFSLVEDINPLYTYKIVDNYDDIRNQSNIYFVTKDLGEGILGKETTSECYRIDKNDFNAITFTNTITIDYEKHKEYYEDQNLLSTSLGYSITHELLHCFGLSDVYTIEGQNTLYRNTFLDTVRQNQMGLENKSFWWNNITPHDYDLLLSMYTPQSNSDDYTQVVEKSNQYKQLYYTNVIKEDKGVEIINAFDDKRTYYFRRYSYLNDEDKQNGIKRNYDLYVTIKDSKYYLDEYVQHNGDRIEAHHEGEVSKVEKDNFPYYILDHAILSLCFHWYNRAQLDLVLYNTTNNEGESTIVLKDTSGFIEWELDFSSEIMHQDDKETEEPDMN